MTETPLYIKIWREFCIKDENMLHIIDRMNGESHGNLIAFRHPEMVVYEESTL